MSVLEIISSTAAATVRAVPGVEDVQDVPFVNLFKRRDDGMVEIDTGYLPKKYPGGVTSLNDDAVELVADREQTRRAAQGSVATFRVPVFVLIIAANRNDPVAARRLAWDLGEETQRRLMSVTPLPTPAMIANTSIAPFEPGPFEAIVIDGFTHGVVLQFFVEYQIRGAALYA